MSQILEVHHVDQSFRAGFWLRRLQVLHKIDLKVPEHSIFGFIGPNGAGKTTLIHLIAGLRRPARGTVKVCGHEATSIEARKRVGYLPERPYFYEHLTGRQMLRYFGRLSGMKKLSLESRITKVLSVVDLSEAKDTELRRYSKGMLQRIGIAQAILHEPELLVLDEPMSGLDPLGRKEMRELIVELASQGRTIFFSTHVIPDVEAICDQIGLIQKGELIGCGPIGQFLAHGPLQTEIGFSGVDLDSAKKYSEFLSLREMADGLRGVVSTQSAVAQVLDKLLKAKAQVLWVTPIRPSLEELFVKTRHS